MKWNTHDQNTRHCRFEMEFGLEEMLSDAVAVFLLYAIYPKACPI